MSQQLATTWPEPAAELEEMDSSVMAEPAPDDETDSAFPLTALPELVADMVRMVSAAKQTPEVLGAICALGVGSAAIGKNMVVASREHQKTPGNLFLIGTAESGSGKSQTMHHYVEPILNIESEQRLKFRNETKPRLQAELERLRQPRAQSPKGTKSSADDALRAEALRRAEEIESELIPPQFMCDDVTSEKLARILASQGECQFSCSSEARNAVKNLCGRYSRNGADTDEVLLLMGYSGERVVVNRVMGADILLENPSIALLWLVQPDKFREMLENPSLTEGGFLPRCLVAHTNAKRQRRTGKERSFDTVLATAYGQRIDALFRAYRMSTSKTPCVVQPDHEAVELMRDFYNSTVDERYADVAPYVARWEENAWRIALVLHALEHGANADKKMLSGDVAARAIAIQKFFGEQQLAFLSAGRQAKRDKRKSKVLEVVAKKFATAKLPVAERIIRQFTNLDGKTVASLLADLVADNHVEQFTIKPPHGPAYIAYAPKK